MLVFLTMLKADEDREEFLKLYEAYSNTMLLVSRKYFGADQDSAEDAVQNAWMRAIENFEKILAVPCEKRGAYLVIIVKNESISLLRKQKPVLPYEDALFDEEITLENSGWQIRKAIRRMPESYRAVLEMYFVGGYTVKEIARKLGLTQPAANSRLYRGRTLLIEKLRKEGYQL